MQYSFLDLIINQLRCELLETAIIKEECHKILLYMAISLLIVATENSISLY